MSPRLGDLDLPHGLDDALAGQQLAVFAGAGVSVAPPSSLPSFDGLTALIGEGADGQRENEPFEVYLGRLDFARVRVHEIAAEVLSNPASRPNELHRAIVGLWSTPEDVRIVTTNFDRHLESVLHEKWPASPAEVWAAPALPVGSAFNGLVYLHGRLDRPHRMVLTDSGFGQAYLTEGWARRFITALFQKYVVLFVGYSHKDAVVSYLARGLAPTREPRRFALADEADPGRWKLLGVEPITYDPANDHAAVLVALQRWGELRTGGVLDHQERIAQRCHRPPVVREDADYLLWCLDQPHLVQFFTRSASGVEWVEWLHAESRLSPLLTLSGDIERDPLLAWLAREMCVSEGSIERSLRLIASPRLTLSDAGYRFLVDALWRRVKAAGKQGEVLGPSTGKLVLYVLRHRPANDRDSAIGYLLEALTPESADLALSIFDELTRPLLNVESRPLFGDDDGDSGTRAELTMHADGQWILRAWEGLLKSLLPTRADQILSIARQHLEQANRLMKASGWAAEFDFLSIGRHSIEAQGDDERAIRSHDSFNVLVDAARDAFEWQLANEPKRAAAGLRDWAYSSAELPQRVAAFGLSKAKSISGDERLGVALERGWLDRGTLRPELLSLLASSYPAASAAQRGQLLDRWRELRVGPPPLMRGENEDEERQWRVRSYLNLLAWLQQSDPDCDVVRERIEELRTVYPEVEPREDPGPDFGVKTGCADTASRFSVEQMLDWTAEEFLRHFAEERASVGNPWETDWVSAYLEEGAKAVRSNFEWSLALAQALTDSGHMESLIWSYLLRGWREARLEPAQWERALSFLEQHLDRLSVVSEVAELLERRGAGDPQDIQDEIIVKGVGLARSLWELCRGNLDADAHGDSLSTAINDPAGKIALFAIRSASLLRERHGDGWVNLAPELSELLHRLALRDDATTPFARLVLCSQLPFLHSLEREWAEEVILPLFDWNDSPEARRSWGGFLGWGRPTAALWPRLKGMMEQTFDHLTELGDQERRFAEFVAACCLWLMEDDFELGWLQQFVQKAGPLARRSFADHLGGFLRDLGPPRADLAWSRWIRTYVLARLAGKPALGDEEWNSMQNWLPYLGDTFGDAVDLYSRRSTSLGSSSIIFYQLSRRESPPGSPRDAARFLLHLLRCQQRPFYECEYVVKICAAIGTIDDPKLERELQERFVELGCFESLFPERPR